MVNLSSTISLLEVIYSTQALAGVFVTIGSAVDGWIDYRHSVRNWRAGLISAEDRRLDLMTALIGILAATGGFIAHGLFLTIGFAAMSVPPAPAERTGTSNYFALSFVAMQSVMLATQIGVQVLRHRLRRPA